MSDLTPADYAAVALEVMRHAGARIQAVHQDGRWRFRLVLQERRGRVDLVLDLDPEGPRVELTPHRVAPGPPTPLAAGLRRRIAHGRLEGARSVPGDRVLAVALRRGGEPWTLWFEGYGRGANLYLVDAAGIVRLTPRGALARGRRAAVGSPFPGPAPRAPSKPPAKPASPTPSAPDRGATGGDAQALHRERLRRALERALARAEREQARLSQDLEAEAEAARLTREGELLGASFEALRRGLTEIRLPDPTAEPPTEVVVALDPRLSPAAQVDARFRAARKARRRAGRARERLPTVQRRAEALGALLGRLASPQEAFAEIERAAGALGVPGPTGDRGGGSRPRPAEPWRLYRSLDGWEILVGRDAAGNEALTFERARPGDLFLHVRGAAGSHVVVPTPRGKTPPLPTLLDAATLAAHFSARRGAPVVEVDYTPRRHVSRARGGPPGAVLLRRARTLTLRPEESRRDRVLSTRRK